MCLRLNRAKLLFWTVSVTALCIFIFYLKSNSVINNYNNILVDPNETDDLKYILQWTKPNTIPFVYMSAGRKTFIERKCRFRNCFVTSDRYFLEDIKLYDVIAFHGPEVIWIKDFPKQRSRRQKYVFASIESSHYYPVCDNRFNGYFNWTWTYKLNSDEPYGYITVRNRHGEIIGPQQVMNWLDVSEMVNVSDKVIDKLQTKTKAAAWMVSNCDAKSGRQKLVLELQQELNRFGLMIDVYGKCGNLKCPQDSMKDCLKLIQKDYYFYLSFENSFSEDYVTEKLLHALQNYAIPIVFGGANYTRFMPDGIYLNAREMGPRKLAESMNEIIGDQEKYYSFFKWHNYYSYHDRNESPDSDDYCKFCEMLNDNQLMDKETVYHDFKSWWNPAEIPEICNGSTCLFTSKNVFIFIVCHLFLCCL